MSNKIYTLVFINGDYADSCNFPMDHIPEFSNCIGKGTISNHMPFWIFDGDVATPERCDRIVSTDLADLAAYGYEVIWELERHFPREVIDRMFLRMGHRK